MKLARASRKHVARHGEAMILFAVGEHTFAAPAAEVDEIRDLQGLESLSAVTAGSSVGKVTAILERAGKTYFVVEASRQFRQAPGRGTRLMVLRGQPVAILVDSIDRMIEVARVLPLPNAFRGDERRWYRGLALIGGAAIPVLSTKSFLTPAEQVIARSLAARLASKGVSA